MFNKILLASFAILSASIASGATVPPVIIVSPIGGEIFVPGQSQFVRLADTTKYKSVRIELSRDGGTTYSLLGVIDNTVPKPNRNFLQFQVAAPISNNCVIRATGISPTRPATGVTGSFVITDTIAPAPSGTAGGDLTGIYPNPTIASNAVTNSKMADGSVTSAKVNSGAASSNFVLTADGSGGADWVSLSSIFPSNLGATNIQTTGTITALNFIGSGAGLTNVPASALPAVGAPYVLKAGDTMTGFLTLSGDPTTNLHAASKQYVDAEKTRATSAEGTLTTNLSNEVTRATAAEVSKVSKGGDTMTGLLTLSGDPTANLHAATKQYVDSVARHPNFLQLYLKAGNGTAMNTFTVPAGVTSILVEAWGAGGGGGGGGYSGNSAGSSGGSGSPGLYLRTVVSVAPGSYTVVVGTGGAAGSAGLFNSKNGGNGGTGGSSIVLVSGGAAIAIALGGGGGGGGTQDGGAAGIGGMSPNTTSSGVQFAQGGNAGLLGQQGGNQYVAGGIATNALFAVISLAGGGSGGNGAPTGGAAGTGGSAGGDGLVIVSY